MNFVVTDPLRCTGCSACMNVCPRQAITMQPDAEGFPVPVISAEKCVGCDLCRQTCSINHPPVRQQGKPEVFAAWHKDPEIRQASSSGGAFSALAAGVLEQGGVVFGAAYAPFPQVRHVMAETPEQLAALRGSKYVQSEIGDSFLRAKQQLKQGRKVLFVGTPCQIMGLKNFLKRDYETLIACDLICHGVPSPTWFNRYLHDLCGKRFPEATAFNFRSKRSGWYDALRICSFGKTGEMTAKGKMDYYFRAFNLNLCLRESCYACPGVGIPRTSDISIADFWGIGRAEPFAAHCEIPEGISLIMIHHEKGKNLLAQSEKDLQLEKRTFEEALRANRPMVDSNHRPEKRDTFYADFAQEPFSSFYKHYLAGAVKDKLVAFIREYCPRSLVLLLRKYM